MRVLPRCNAESSICSINYNSPPPQSRPSPLLYSATCFLSMAPQYVSEIQESTFSTVADAIPYKLHPRAHPSAPTHTDTLKKFPAGILMSYLLGSESEKQSK